MTGFDQSFNIDAQLSAALCGQHPDVVLAMAYVPDQCWDDLYDENLALLKGTLFPDLDKPFTGRKQVRNG
ncbi:MAG: spore coat associated protein CotJA [Ruminococcaceae bacterium]|nr:spore coat associated protein CotJA [Oscillospiraceae bacterium]